MADSTSVTLSIASSMLAERLDAALPVKRPTKKGRKSDLACWTEGTKKHDLYVKGAAEALGITVTHMSRIITGRNRPGMELAMRISKLSGCSIESILAISDARLREDSSLKLQ